MLKRILLLLSLYLALSFSLATAQKEGLSKKLKVNGEENAPPSHASLTFPGKDWGSPSAIQQEQTVSASTL